METAKPDTVEAELVDRNMPDVRRTDVPVTVEQLAALGGDKSEGVVKARVQILRTLRAESIKMTHPQDWVLYKDPKTERVVGYCQDTGTQRFASLWGIEVFDISDPRQSNTADGKDYSISLQGNSRCRITGIEISNVIGTRYSTENYAQQQPEGLPRWNAVCKAARANLDGSCVRAHSGLKSVPLDELVKQSGIADFEKRASKGRGYGTQAERMGGEMQQADDIKPGEEPFCEQCNPPRKMKFVPGGTSRSNKPYPAFWACPVQNSGHKSRDAGEYLKGIKEQRARAGEPEKPTEGDKSAARQPGEEG